MMFRKWFLRLMVPTIAVAFGAMQAQAQLGEFGAKAGVASSSLSNAEDVSAGTGFSGGVFATVGTMVKGQFEVLYTDRKLKSSEVGDDSSVSEKFIDIPLFLAVKPGRGPVQVKLYVGPQLSIKTSCKISDGTSTIDCTTAALSVNSTIWSAVGGAALDIALGGVFLEIDARYGLGLTNVVGDAGDGFAEDSKWRTLQFFGGIGIPVGTQP